MNHWDFATRIDQEYGLRVTKTERERFQKRYPKQPGVHGGFPADAVFEGGGVLGIAFLGAVRCCDDFGMSWRSLAGTSAGAITASLLAAGLALDDIEDAIGGKDFLEFLGEPAGPLTSDGNPANDLDHFSLTCARLAACGKLGEYSSDRFKSWMEDLLKGEHVHTFRDIAARHGGTQKRELRVVVSDLTHGQMLVLPHEDRRKCKASDRFDMSVAEAVRLSMSIPLFFEPGELDGAVIVDGGVLSNYPVWLFDEEPEPDDPAKLPGWPTFGFRLIDREDKEEARIRSVTDLLKAMVFTMQSAHDRHHLSKPKRTRTINIDVSHLELNAISFNLTDDQKAELYLKGYRDAKSFLKRFSWKEHMRSRGYDVRGLGVEAGLERSRSGGEAAGV